MTYDCQKCKYNGLVPMDMAVCLGCDRKFYLCPDCWPTFTTCEGGCSVKWREEAKAVLQKPISPDAGLPKKRQKKPNAEQGDLFLMA